MGEAEAFIRHEDCPKCLSPNTWMVYCDGCRYRAMGEPCRHGDVEHFHRGCKRCQYKWRTDDVKDAKVACPHF